MTLKDDLTNTSNAVLVIRQDGTINTALPNCDVLAMEIPEVPLSKAGVMLTIILAFMDSPELVERATKHMNHLFEATTTH